VRGIAKIAALTALTCLIGVAVADDQDTVDYRKHVMKSLGEQLGAIDMIVARKAPPDSFAVHLKTIAVIASQAKVAFEPNVPGGNSKPDVWSHWADFAKRLDAMVAAADGLAKDADPAKAAAVGPKVRAALDCDGCHAGYMTPPKS